MRSAVSQRYQQKYPSSNRPRYDPHVEQKRNEKKYERLLYDMKEAGFQPVDTINSTMPNLLQNH
jgi:hypothetical protein